MSGHTDMGHPAARYGQQRLEQRRAATAVWRPEAVVRPARSSVLPLHYGCPFMGGRAVIACLSSRKCRRSPRIPL